MSNSCIFLISARKEMLKECLTYLDKNYNGIDGYLDSIGFTKEWRAKLN